MALMRPRKKSSTVQPRNLLSKPEEESSWLSSDESSSSLRHLSSHRDSGEETWLLSYADMMTLLFGLFVMLMSFSKLDVEGFEKARRETTHLFGGDFKKTDEQLKEKIGEKVDVKGGRGLASFDEMENGLSITFRGSVFFDSGSAEIKAEALALLKEIIPVLKSQTYEYNVVAEGHTDDNIVASERFPSNWELSSQRASALLRVFESYGYDRTHLRAVGFADTLPIAPNRDPAGLALPKNQEQNRRVVIKLVRSGGTKQKE